MEAAIAANRFGLGAKPGEVERIGPPRDWLRHQLRTSPPVLSGLSSSAQILVRTQELRREALERRRSAADGEREGNPGVRLAALYRPIYADEVHARFSHAIGTDRPFIERLTQFWSNHFAVSVDKVVVSGIAGAFEREAIRPNVLGRFSDLLLAVEKHPAMLLYLDNATSMGPKSRAAARLRHRSAGRKVDINENLAREILELHTLGVRGGYSQADVTVFAQALSGWSVGSLEGRRYAGLADPGVPGTFHFRESFHEPGAKRLLGRRYADGGLAQGESILRDLAVRPETARHVCTKLARHFIADAPPEVVIDRMSRAWLEEDGRLTSVYQALIDSPEAWREPRAKYKTPADYLHSVYRGLGLPPRDRRRTLRSYESLGQRVFAPGSPAGWPDTSADWDGPSALLKRIAWADAVAMRVADRNARELAPQLLGPVSEHTTQALARAESGAQALTLLLSSPEFMRR